MISRFLSVRSIKMFAYASSAVLFVAVVMKALGMVTGAIDSEFRSVGGYLIATKPILVLAIFVEGIVAIVGVLWPLNKGAWFAKCLLWFMLLVASIVLLAAGDVDCPCFGSWKAATPLLVTLDAIFFLGAITVFCSKPECLSELPDRIHVYIRRFGGLTAGMFAGLMVVLVLLSVPGISSEPSGLVSALVEESRGGFKILITNHTRLPVTVAGVMPSCSCIEPSTRRLKIKSRGTAVLFARIVSGQTIPSRLSVTLLLSGIPQQRLRVELRVVN